MTAGTRTAELTYITTCKGRLAHLKQALPRAVAVGLPCVVVDYSCPEGSAQWLEAHFPQTTIVRAEGEAGFHAARARNLGAAAARTPWLAFFDVDVLLEPAFGEIVVPALTAGHFYRASPVTRQTWGSIICARDDFAAVGGYDETYRGWGGEDDDLIRMLLLSGRRPAHFAASLVGEISHSDEVRTHFYEIQDLFLQQRINHTFMQVKFDMLRLLGKPLPAAERKTVYEQIQTAILTAEDKNRGTPIVIEVPIPRAVIEGPPTNEGMKQSEFAVLQRKLTYTLTIQRRP